ncbi:Fasciclin-domain-containing protein [Tothia fuscella]|uniref:Fasciclin-domain-containing protein n=1 Tax=Tothia fuscella TaxID=1048955 RepID=A0A9P4NRK5_9PEZI|nr:Fasciclin-domain-containing protein [Tothia fuscella]
MLFQYLSSAVLLSVASAQSLTQVLSGNNQTSQLAGLVGGFPNLVTQLGSARNITLLAPSNNALGTLLNSTAGKALAANSGAVQALLQYHVLNGTYRADAVTNTSAFIPTALTNTTYANVTGGQRIEALRAGTNVTFFSGLLANTSVVQADVPFDGGVIHVIDKVLTLPASINDTLIAARLSSLAGALNATNLLGTVSGLQDVTIFAPNNAAFRAIGSALANASVETLTSILTYHVIDGTTPLYSSSLTNGTSVATVNGASLTVTFGANNTVFVNGAKVVTPNVLVAGGVVHVIDAVLNPSATAGPTPSATAGTGAFSGASSATNEPFTSGVAVPTTTVGGGAGAASSTSSRANAPMMTGAVGAAALFGAAAFAANM